MISVALTETVDDGKQMDSGESKTAQKSLAQRFYSTVTSMASP